MTNACNAKEIDTLNETKEYALIASSLLDTIISDPSLTAQTAKLWLLLYNKAKFNKNMEITLSQKSLSKILNRTTRTITNYIRVLEGKGYLIIKNNFSKIGQLANTYLIRFPQHLIEKCLTKKDRKLAQKGDKQNIKLLQRESSEEKTFRGGDETNFQRNTIKYNTNKKQQQEEPKIVFQSKSVEQATKVESVVVSSEMKNEKQKINEDIAKLKSQHIDAKENFNKNPLHHENLKTLTRIEQHIEQKKLQLEKIYREDNTKNKLNSVLDAKGKRSVSDSLRKMLASKLKRIGRNEQDIQRLTNEIAYESRFGSLVFDNQTKRENPVAKSVNIALKLINEGRWATPSGLGDY